jgi:hypothetical protein
MKRGGEKNMKAKLLGIGAALSGLLMPVVAHAQTVIPIPMDSGVQGQITNLFTSYVTIAFSLLAVVIGVVGTLWISMKGIGLLFKYFHWFGH